MRRQGWFQGTLGALLSLPILSSAAAAGAISKLAEEGKAASGDWNPCSAKEFEYNKENWEDSNAAGYYQNWSIAIDPQSDLFTENSEINRFAREHWGDEAFACTYDDPPCTREPYCHEIWAKVSDGGNVTEEAIQNTRRAFFAARAIVKINRYQNLKARMIYFVTANLIPQLDNMIKDHSSPSGLTDVKHCEIVDDVMRPMYTMYIDIMTQASGLDRSNISFIADLEAVAIDKAVTSMGNSKLDKKLTLKTWILPRVLASPIYNKCVAENYNRNNNHPERFRQFASFLSGQFMGDQTSLTFMIDALNDGAFNGRSHGPLTTMGDWMAATFWPTVPGLKEQTWKHDFTRAWEHPVITAIWTRNRCHVKCKPQPDSVAECPWNRDAGYDRSEHELWKWRICSDNEDVVCQVQCWAANKHDNIDNILYNIEALDKYNLMPNEVVKNSWNLYQRHHNYGLLGDFKPDPVNYNEESFTGLPVCYSRDVDIVDFSHGGWRADDRIGFPFSCGDWRGNETKRFMDLMGYRLEDRDEDRTRWTFQKLLLWATRKMTPARRFLAMCENQVHWPYTKSELESHKDYIRKHGWIKKIIKPLPGAVLEGPDARCAEIKAGTEGMTGQEANVWFCSRLENANGLFREELASFRTVGTKRLGGLSHDSHRTLCEKFDKNEFDPDWLDEVASPLTNYE